MRLSCPQCHTEYDVPDAALAGAARTLRCADCGTKFKAPALPAAAAAPEPIASEPEALADAVPETEFDITPHEIDHAMIETPDVVAAAPASEPEVAISAAPPVSSLSQPAQPRPAAPRLAARKPAAATPNRGLGISILLVLLVIGIVLAEHKAIGHAWPPSLRLFNALGLH